MAAENQNIAQYIVGSVIATITGFAAVNRLMPRKKPNGKAEEDRRKEDKEEAKEYGALCERVEHHSERVTVLSEDVKRLFVNTEEIAKEVAKIPAAVAKVVREERFNCPHAQKTTMLWDEHLKQKVSP